MTPGNTDANDANASAEGGKKKKKNKKKKKKAAEASAATPAAEQVRYISEFELCFTLKIMYGSFCVCV